MHSTGSSRPTLSEPGAVRRRFDRWMAYYDGQGIEAIDAGLINLRRRPAERNWIQVDTDRLLNHPNGMGIAVGFAARDPGGARQR